MDLGPRISELPRLDDIETFDQDCIGELNHAEEGLKNANEVCPDLRR